MTRRAYINPLPGYGEAAQRADILAKFDKIDEWYVESKRTTRANFIQHLRAGDEAIVARSAASPAAHAGSTFGWPTCWKRVATFTPRAVW